jgi:hypothetical protein
MKEVTVEIDAVTLRRARLLAESCACDLNEILSDWLSHYSENLPVEMLPNDEVLKLCQAGSNTVLRRALHSLLHANIQRTLAPEERQRLDALLQAYRRMLIRQSRAYEVASARGLEVS